MTTTKPVGMMWRPVPDGVYQHEGNVIGVTAAHNQLSISELKRNMTIYVGQLPANWRLCEAVALPELDWSQAPEWAKWWAVDASGRACWYSAEPERDQEDAWWCGAEATYAYDVDIPLGVDWRLLKAQCPQGDEHAK